MTRAILVKGSLKLQMQPTLKKPLGQAFTQSQINTCFVLGCFSFHKKSGYKIAARGWGTSFTIGSTFPSSWQNQERKIKQQQENMKVKHSISHRPKWNVSFQVSAFQYFFLFFYKKSILNRNGKIETSCFSNVNTKYCIFNPFYFIVGDFFLTGWFITDFLADSIFLQCLS